MPSILLTNFYDAKSLDVVKALLPNGFNLISLQKSGKEEVFRLVDKAEYIIAGGRVPIDRELLDQANRLRMIQRSGVGLDKIDVDTLKKKDIPLYINKGINARSVAEHTLLLILSVLRQLVIANATTKSGDWMKQQLGNQNLDLFGKTVGLVGMGEIGEYVARLLKPFGVTILYNKRNKLSPSAEKKLQVQYADFTTLLKTSDILSIHCPYNRDTHHLIGQKEFENMKLGVILINTARGSIVDEYALFNSLQNKKVRGAGLDVFEEEPARDNPLFELENVVVSPHIAGVTKETFKRIYSEAFNNIVAFHNNELHVLEDKRVI